MLNNGLFSLYSQFLRKKTSSCTPHTSTRTKNHERQTGRKSKNLKTHHPKNRHLKLSSHLKSGTYHSNPSSYKKPYCFNSSALSHRYTIQNTLLKHLPLKNYFSALRRFRHSKSPLFTPCTSTSAVAKFVE